MTYSRLRVYAFRVALFVFLSAGVVSTAQARHQHQRMIHTLPAGQAVYPEGIAYHPGTGDLFVGSFTTGAVYRGSVRPRSGPRTMDEFLPAGADGRTMAVGMQVDRHGRLWIAGGSTGTIWVYDAVTGRFLVSFYLGVANSFINDVAIRPQGDAYFTDSFQPWIYRIAADHTGALQYEPWLDLRGTAVAYTDGFNLNGIAASADGQSLIVVQSNTGRLFHIDVASKQVSPIDLKGERLDGGDGLVLDGTTLYVVRNQVNLVVTVALAPTMRSGRIVGSFSDPSLDFPTTAVKVGGRLVLPNSQLSRLFATPPVAPTLPFTVSSLVIPD